jgi:thiol-disulfide isomerase/thioredoxin
MNRKILFTLGVILAVSIGGGIYLLTTDSGKAAKEAMISESTPAEINTSTSNSPNQTPGTYVDYSEDAVASAKGTRVLFFYAPWCPQCRALDDDIRVKGAPDGVTIIKTDYDSNQALRQKYGITLQTTFVRIDDNGNLIKKFVAYDEPTLASVIKNLL